MVEFDLKHYFKVLYQRDEILVTFLKLFFIFPYR